MNGVTLDTAIRTGDIQLGRGNIISSKDIAKYPGDYPIYSSSAKGSGEFGRYGHYMFDEELITWSVDGGGRFFFRPKHKFSVTNVCGYMHIDGEKWNRQFVYYVLDFQHQRITFDYQTKAHPSVIRHLYSLPNTPGPEQTKIAEILSTVDQAIDQTEALIAKQQRIKTGLMQDLLTRGIDENGNLRSEETHEFKDSPLGRIPVEWGVERLGIALRGIGGFLQTGPFGSQLHAHEYVHEGVPVVMPRDILHGEISKDKIARIPGMRANNLGRHRVRVNDIIFSRRGDLTRAAAIGEHESGWVCGTGCFLLRAPVTKMDSRWLADVYRHHQVQLQVDANAVGSTMPSLNNDVMERLLIAFPSLAEQREITRRLNAIDAVRKPLVNNLAKLRSLKTALMQDLLTGKVSVAPLLTDTEGSV